MRRANDLLDVHVSWARCIALSRWGCCTALALLATSAGCSGDDNASPGTDGTAGVGGQGGGAGTGAGSKNTGSGGGGAPGTGGFGGLAGSSGGPAAGGTGGSAGSGGDAGSGGSGGDVSSGGNGGDAGSGGSGGDAGSGGGEDGGPPEAGIEVFPCAINVVENTYNAAGVGCNGIVSCRGVIGYMNNSGVRLTFPTITFSGPDGVTCAKTHSTSKWIISDNGAV